MIYWNNNNLIIYKLMRGIRNIKNCSHNIWNMCNEVKCNNKGVIPVIMA